ncbi:pimeloyl-ACP methyl ester carboxylesterase [Paraburkholderia sp. GAS348]|jgi:hypothetical protein
MKAALDASQTSNRGMRPGTLDFDALVIVHGFLDSHEVWNPLIKALYYTGIPAVAVDPREGVRATCRGR